VYCNCLRCMNAFIFWVYLYSLYILHSGLSSEKRTKLYSIEANTESAPFINAQALLKGHGRGRLDRELVVGRNANRFCLDQDRALRELVPHLHVVRADNQQLNYCLRNPAHTKSNSDKVRFMSLRPWGWSLWWGFSDTRATVLARVINRTCFKQHSSLLLSRHIGFRIAPAISCPCT